MKTYYIMMNLIISVVVILLLLYIFYYLFVTPQEYFDPDPGVTGYNCGNDGFYLAGGINECIINPTVTITNDFGLMATPYNINICIDGLINLVNQTKSLLLINLMDSDDNYVDSIQIAPGKNSSLVLSKGGYHYFDIYDESNANNKTRGTIYVKYRFTN